ncbi:hypothetical protein HUT16_27485 [Kitasatospora sp. NA04385]|uniref:hypothetical protein n=1 Tax=Kitasatospora sp. NA04385 TaxID=2742135 RepID=UPI0015907911|nr:hypothetical protein [Kitasatospora sp. NA04385]QKW22323.1 hypothetical protein HUT16_27485 [Kitasatospora sp. NA04385]
MDRREKQQRRNYIGEYLDISSTRMTDDEVMLLCEFIEMYDKSYRGVTKTRTRRGSSWSSDGKYTYSETFTDTFTDDIGIRQDYQYTDDDGGRRESTTIINDARGVLNWLRENS